MALDAVTVVVFTVLALFVPLSMLLLAKLIGARTTQNPVKLKNYESAEELIGHGRDITNDYLHYFPLYLGFELIVVVLLGWAMVSNIVGSAIGFAVIGISAGGFVLAALAMGLAHSKGIGASYG